MTGQLILDAINSVGRWLVILFVIYQAAELASAGVMSEQATAAILGSAITAISTAAGVAIANGKKDNKPAAK